MVEGMRGRVPWVGVGALTPTRCRTFHPPELGGRRPGRGRRTPAPGGPLQCRRRSAPTASWVTEASATRPPGRPDPQRYHPAMASSRSRRRLVICLLLAGVVGSVVAYRRRELARNAEEFHARYG